MERRVEARVVQRETDLARELGEDALLIAAERVSVGRPLHHDQPEELSRVGNRGDSKDGFPPSLEEAGEPELRPCRPRDARSDDDRLLVGGQRHAGGVSLGVGHCPLEGPARPCPHLGRAQPKRLAERLGEL